MHDLYRCINWSRAIIINKDLQKVQKAKQTHATEVCCRVAALKPNVSPLGANTPNQCYIGLQVVPQLYQTSDTHTHTI